MSRLRLGRLANGVYGLHITMPGYHTSTADPNNSEQTSFYSEWTDMVQVHQAGVVSVAATVAQAVPITGLGYRAFYEIRKYGGGVFWDDSFDTNIVGVNSDIDATELRAHGLASGSYSAVYVIYRQPLAFQ